jgi:hypothetical protein
MSENNTDTEPGKAVVNIDEMLRKQLAELNSRVAPPSSNKISTKGKVFTLPNGKSGPELNVIILDWRHVLANYPGMYNANNPQDPDCFAVGVNSPESGLLTPHESIKKPHGKDCKTCPKNQWKSAAGGQGKACKNQVRLLVSRPDADATEQPATLYVSPTGLKSWNAYVSDLAKIYQEHLIQVVTHISFDPNEAYPKLLFKRLEKNTRVTEMWGLKERYSDMVDRPIELRNQK